MSSLAPWPPVPSVTRDDVAPSWFSDALAAPVDVGEVEVAGTPVRFRAWGQPGPRGLVLVHGGGAHSRWWDHIAPLLAERRRVVALDLSGHGDSGRRPEYSMSGWAEDVIAVAAASGAGPAPILIGHSMGGAVTLTAARRFGPELGGCVVVDTPVRELPPEEVAARDHRAFGPVRVYPSKEEAVRRFRLVPDQPRKLPYVLAHIAEHSVREIDGGWAWKFDPRSYRRRPLAPADISRLPCRVAVFRAEHGILSAEMVGQLVRRLGPEVPVVEIPAAAHHVLVDEPLALVTGLRTLLSGWECAADVVDSGRARPAELIQ